MHPESSSGDEKLEIQLVTIWQSDEGQRCVETLMYDEDFCSGPSVYKMWDKTRASISETLRIM
jgi:hypothetical protein